MIDVSLEKIAAWAGSNCPAGSEHIRIQDICKDSRAAHPGSLFVPLPGTRFDGHDFLAAAAANGASAALCARDDISVDIPLLHVQDVLQADWQDVWHSPQPPFSAVFLRFTFVIVLMFFIFATSF